MNAYARVFIVIVAAGAALLAGCGSSSAPTGAPAHSRADHSTGHRHPGGTGYSASRTSQSHSDTCKGGQYVGNRKTHVVHKPGSGNLPSPRNQVCFASLAAAEAAGYHPSKGG